MEIGKIVRKAKDRVKNVYALDDRLFSIVYCVTAAVLGCALFEMILGSLPALARTAMIAAVVLAGAALGTKGCFDYSRWVEGYCRKKDFEFIGLYDMSQDTNLLDSSDVLPRTDEMTHIRDVLETIIFPQVDVKQILCLTGQSGCGKSTILTFFRQKYKEEYAYIDLTGDYNGLEGRIEELLGSNPEQRIAQMTYQKKVVVMLDQFERYFFLREDKKKRVRRVIAQLGRKNSAIIVSLREEYLADFLKEFDMNNLKSTAQDAHRRPTGILRPLVSIIEDRAQRFRRTELNESVPVLEWKGTHIKNNSIIHVQRSESVFSGETIEKMGVTLFYCENQNAAIVLDEGKNKNSAFLRSKCERIFGEKGKDFFEKYRNSPLIEQQIAYQMAEFDQKIRHLSAREMQHLFDMEEYDLLNRYFDIQLTSSGDYFHASRIMYILSKARLHQVSIKEEELRASLYVEQFGEIGGRRYAHTIDKLKEYQLIRCCERNSTQEYEVAHDYVAEAFINYSNSNINRNVRGALDIFFSEYLEAQNHQKQMNRIKHISRAGECCMYKRICYLSTLIALIADMCFRYIYNPWTTFLVNYNPYGDQFPLFVPLITTISIIYLGQIYDKILKYHYGSKRRMCVIVYIPLMILATSSLLLYPHIVMIDGICVAIMGLNCAFLLDGRYQEASRKELLAYGLKCATIGTVFACSHTLFCYFNSGEFPRYLIFVEMIMLAVLVLYSHVTHMTKEYLYARLMDASSQCVKGKEF